MFELWEAPANGAGNFRQTRAWRDDLDTRLRRLNDQLQGGEIRDDVGPVTLAVTPVQEKAHLTAAAGRAAAGRQWYTDLSTRWSTFWHQVPNVHVRPLLLDWAVPGNAYNQQTAWRFQVAVDVDAIHLYANEGIGAAGGLLQGCRRYYEAVRGDEGEQVALNDAPAPDLGWLERDLADRRGQIATGRDLSPLVYMAPMTYASHVCSIMSNLEPEPEPAGARAQLQRPTIVASVVVIVRQRDTALHIIGSRRGGVNILFEARNGNGTVPQGVEVVANDDRGIERLRSPGEDATNEIAIFCASDAVHALALFMSNLRFAARFALVVDHLPAGGGHVPETAYTMLRKVVGDTVLLCHVDHAVLPNAGAVHVDEAVAARTDADSMSESSLDSGDYGMQIDGAAAAGTDAESSMSESSFDSGDYGTDYDTDGSGGWGLDAGGTTPAHRLAPTTGDIAGAAGPTVPVPATAATTPTARVDAPARPPFDVESLNAAAAWGHDAMIDLLVEEYGLDPNAVDEDEWTALHYAVWSGRARTVKHLVERHNVDIHKRDRYGETALDLADKYRETDCAAVLRGYGATNGVPAG